jgi:hypothetical protein
VVKKYFIVGLCILFGHETGAYPGGRDIPPALDYQFVFNKLVNYSKKNRSEYSMYAIYDHSGQYWFRSISISTLPLTFFRPLFRPNYGMHSGEMRRKTHIENRRTP